jgi:hypothetical protein
MQHPGVFRHYMSGPEPALRGALTEPTITLPVSHAATIADRRHGIGIRAWMLTALLFLVPLVPYWPATFHEYGLRDDYSNLREAHEEPGTVLKFCASHARPIYGWLLQTTYGQTSSVQNLQWLRFAAVLMLGAISLVMFRGLRFLGWSYRSSLFFAMLLALVPASQVIAGWALLAIAGFFTVEGALQVALSAGRARAAGHWALALVLMVVSALIYQPSALFYVVPLAGALIAYRRRSLSRALRWLGIHLGFVMVSRASPTRRCPCCTRRACSQNRGVSLSSITGARSLPGISKRTCPTHSACSC